MSQKKLKLAGLEQIKEEEEIESMTIIKVKAWKNMERINDFQETCVKKMKQDIFISNNSNSSTIVEDDLVDFNDLNEHDIPIFNRNKNYFWKVPRKESENV